MLMPMKIKRIMIIFIQKTQLEDYIISPYFFKFYSYFLKYCSYCSNFKAWPKY